MLCGGSSSSTQALAGTGCSFSAAGVFCVAITRRSNAFNQPFLLPFVTDAQVVSFKIGLKRSPGAEVRLEEAARAASMPSSPSYRHYLSSEQMHSLAAAPHPTVNAVIRFLDVAGNGKISWSLSVHGDYLRCEASVFVVESVFKVRNDCYYPSNVYGDNIVSLGSVNTRADTIGCVSPPPYHSCRPALPQCAGMAAERMDVWPVSNDMGWLAGGSVP